MALLRGDDERAYWRVVVQHAVITNLQAVLDEYAHVLRESLGLFNQGVDEIVSAVAEEMVEALTLRSASVQAEEFHAREGGSRVRTRDFTFRTRFAVRFSELREGDEGGLKRSGAVRKAFNSPFRPFVLASTSIGQEGLDFHPYCHAVYH
jgi:hypothetical protein